MTTFLSTLYNLAWLIALPLLRCSPRITEGWKQRTLKTAPRGPFDLWIQAASGGEAQISNMIIAGLGANLSDNDCLKILATSGTSQGVEILKKGFRNSHLTNKLEVHTGFFPFDAPFLMEKAFQRFAPHMAVIIETELWPGFLINSRKTDTPVFLVNGRMSDKSCRSYIKLHSFFKKFGPQKILAVSDTDRERFARLVGIERTERMNNIKFDRIEPNDATGIPSSTANIIPENKPFLVLGSVRREEEEKILETIKMVLEKKPEIVIGLFPKHLERADQWMKVLEENLITAEKRSQINKDHAISTVIVWDRFGELTETYRHADAAFVGGSLVDLGGQNFLEPLISGLKPVIGPYWKNFAWIDSEVFTTGLVSQVTNEHELAARLLADLEDQEDKEKVIRQARDFFATKKGGTQQACKAILHKLQTLQDY